MLTFRSICVQIPFTFLPPICLYVFTVPMLYFQVLIECRTAVAGALGVAAESLELSMGMSGDYEHAVSQEALLPFLFGKECKSERKGQT